MGVFTEAPALSVHTVGIVVLLTLGVLALAAGTLLTLWSEK